jgi:hypothetical protein
MGLFTICETGAGEAREGEDGSELHVDFLEAAGDCREWEDVRGFVDIESCHNSSAMS